MAFIFCLVLKFALLVYNEVLSLEIVGQLSQVICRQDVWGIQCKYSQAELCWLV